MAGVFELSNFRQISKRKLSKLSSYVNRVSPYRSANFNSSHSWKKRFRLKRNLLKSGNSFDISQDIFFDIIIRPIKLSPPTTEYLTIHEKTTRKRKRFFKNRALSKSYIAKLNLPARGDTSSLDTITRLMAG